MGYLYLSLWIVGVSFLTLYSCGFYSAKLTSYSLICRLIIVDYWIPTWRSSLHFKSIIHGNVSVYLLVNQLLCCYVTNIFLFFPLLQKGRKGVFAFSYPVIKPTNVLFATNIVSPPFDGTIPCWLYLTAGALCICRASVCVSVPACWPGHISKGPALIHICQYTYYKNSFIPRCLFLFFEIVNFSVWFVFWCCSFFFFGHVLSFLVFTKKEISKFAAVIRPAGDIDRLLHGARQRWPNTGSATLSAYVEAERRLV